MVFQTGLTALMSASRGGHTIVVSILLAAGADVNMRHNVSTPYVRSPTYVCMIYNNSLPHLTVLCAVINSFSVLQNNSEV